MNGIAAEMQLSNLKILFGLCMNYEMVDFLKKKNREPNIQFCCYGGPMVDISDTFLSQLDAYTYNS